MARKAKTDAEKLKTYVNKLKLSETEAADLLISVASSYRPSTFEVLTKESVVLSPKLKLKDLHKELMKDSTDDLLTKQIELIVSTTLLTIEEFQKRKNGESFLKLFVGMVQMASFVELKDKNFGDVCLSCEDYPKCFKIFDGDMVIEINETMSEKQIFINLYSFFVRSLKKEELLKLWQIIKVLYNVN